MKRRILKMFACAGLLLILLIATNVGFEEIYSLPNDFVASYEEVKDANLSKKFGLLINTSVKKNSQNVSKDSNEDGVIVFKLFGFIPIRKVTVKLAPEEEVYIGGVPVGISISSKGAIVEGEKNVLVNGHPFQTEKTEKLKKGDLIYEVNGEKVDNLEKLNQIVENSENDQVEVKFLRQNKEMKSIIKCVPDENNKLKMGLLVKDDVSGVGTLTYVSTKTSKFGALGHAITEKENTIDVFDGDVYACNLLGIQKGERNNPGQLRCVFLQNKGEKGEIQKNNKYGVFGQLKDKTGLVDENLTAKIGGRLSVMPGKASIVSSVSGIREEYEIEIIKASYQSKADDKSITFRVTDKRLLDLTGGIVQGMSGSPILQNGKLVGAVTHVFISDPTKGYGVYSDWMMLNS